MPITQHASGSQTTTIGTEHTLNPTTPETSLGAYQLWLDPFAMAGGDTLEIRVKERARGADTQRLVFLATLFGPQAEMFVTPVLVLMHGWDMTIRQTTGSGRAYPWSIRRVT